MRDHDQEHVCDMLQRLGFVVEQLTVSTDKRPDLLAQRDGERLFVEVKSRRLDASLRKAMESVRPGDQQTIETTLEKHNTLSAEITGAVVQLEALAGADDYRLLWYRADLGPFVHGVFEQITSTLLGTRCVRTASGTLRKCAYAGFGDFYRCASLDGVMIEVDEGINLLPNHFSPRCNRFAKSAMWASLPSRCVLDVLEASTKGGWLIVEGPVDRRDDAALLAHLQHKYPAAEIVGFEVTVATTHVTTIDAQATLDRRGRKGRTL